MGCTGEKKLNVARVTVSVPVKPSVSTILLHGYKQKYPQRAAQLKALNLIFSLKRPQDIYRAWFIGVKPLLKKTASSYQCAV